MGNCYEMVRGEAPEGSRTVSGSQRQGVGLVCPSVGEMGLEMLSLGFKNSNKTK